MFDIYFFFCFEAKKNLKEVRFINKNYDYKLFLESLLILISDLK